MLGWIFFRAQSVEQAFVMYEKLFHVDQYILYLKKLPAIYYYSVASCLISLCILHLLKYRMKLFDRKFGLALRYSCIAVMFALVVLFLDNETQFIYFQF